MKSFIFIHIAYSWVYRLYEEYISSIFYIFQQLNWKVEKNIFICIENFKIDDFSIQYRDLYASYPDTQFVFSGDISIFCQICHHFDFISKNRNSFLNIEQMSHPSYYIYFRNIPEYIPIIDYSEENVNQLKSHYSISYISPFFIQENISIGKKTIDCLSIYNNGYRKKKIDDIEENFNTLYKKKESDTQLKIHRMDNCYGEVRNELFRKTKIYINIHCSDEHKTLELIRIARLLSMGIIVLSQDILEPSICALSKYIYIVKMEFMHDMIKEILDNYPHYYEELQKTWDEKEYFNSILQNTNSSFSNPSYLPSDSTCISPSHDHIHSDESNHIHLND